MSKSFSREKTPDLGTVWHAVILTPLLYNFSSLCLIWEKTQIHRLWEAR